MRKYFVILFFLLFCIIHIQAQSNEIDELGKALIYAQNAQELDIAFTNYYDFLTSSSSKDVEVYAKQAEDYFVRLDSLSSNLQIRLLWMRGLRHELLVQRGQALKNYAAAYQKAKEEGLLFERGLSAKLVATIYIRLGLQEQAIIYALDASQIFTKIDNRKQKVSLLYTIGDIYFQVGDYQDAITNYKTTFQYAERNNFEWEKRYAANNLGVAYRNINQLDSALYYYTIARTIAEHMQDSIAIALAIGNMGEIYYRKGEKDKAKDYLLEDAYVSGKAGNWGSAANALVLLGKMARESQQLEQATVYLDSAYTVAKRFNITRTIASSLDEIAVLETKKGNYQKALLLTKQAQAIYDSINHNEIAINLAAVQSAFENGQALAQVNSLRQENQEKEQWIWFGMIVFLMLVVFLTIVIYQNYQKKILNQELLNKNNQITEQLNELSTQKERIATLNKNLEEKVQERTEELRTSIKNLAQVQHELDAFMYRASHDLRGPLVRLVGLVNLMQMETKDLPFVQTYISLFDNSLKQMDTMLRRLMQLHDLIEEKPCYTLIDELDLFVEETKIAAYDYAKNGVRIHTHIEKNAPLITDKKWLRLIILNFLRNSLIYHNQKKEPQIDLFIKVDEKEILVEVVDNGEGILPEFMGTVFDMFVRSSERSIGSGLGLYLVKKAVDKLDGSIFCDSEPEKRTAFTVYIPNQPYPTAKKEVVEENEVFIFA